MTPQTFDSDQAAALSVVTAYSAAEAEVAATLSLEPLRFTVEESSPLWERRAEALARRKETNASHTTRLLLRAVGTIAIDESRTTATIVTQETWEDRSQADGIPTATIRVSYTLRRVNTQAVWKIYDATSTVP